MKKLFTALALATLIATPAFAATSQHQAAPSTRQLYMYAPGGGDDAARNAAMQECNAEAAKWSNSSWETTQLAVYGTCMTEHGQRP
jgi:hypothetical protein